MQQATNTPLKGTKKKKPCTDVLINTKAHAIPELLLSNASLNEQKLNFSYTQQIKSMYHLNVNSAHQCIKEISKQGHEEEREK